MSPWRRWIASLMLAVCVAACSGPKDSIPDKRYPPPGEPDRMKLPELKEPSKGK